MLNTGVRINIYVKLYRIDCVSNIHHTDMEKFKLFRGGDFDVFKISAIFGF